MKRCDERNDEWGEEVRSRLITCTGLVADKAIYHCECMTKFQHTILSSNKVGRPINAVMMDNFERVCNWLEEESDCELYTIAELHEKMVQLSEGSICYSEKFLKRKLIERFEDHVFFAHQPGRPNIICFKDYVWFIMSEFKKIQSQTSLDIITAAAKMIKNDIRVMPCDKKKYPDISRMQDIKHAMTWIPESLTTFFSHLVSSPLKQASIGQVIIQNSRPRSITASIPFGIGVDIDKSFATKWLVDYLSQFGFSIYSDEVKLFKQLAITSAREIQAEECQSDFTQ